MQLQSSHLIGLISMLLNLGDDLVEPLFFSTLMLLNLGVNLVRSLFFSTFGPLECHGFSEVNRDRHGSMASKLSDVPVKFT